MSILVIGGSGSLGNALVPLLLSHTKDEIRILSRGEHKQSEMDRRFKTNQLQFYVGDVRDRDRVLEVMEGCSSVFHLAAYKSVDTAERHVVEAIQTNVMGTINVVHCARRIGVGEVVFVSTDKAVEPINAYGRSKALAESIVIAGNARGPSRNRVPKFSVARYGNVFGSNGSVLVLWKNGDPKVTDANMTRFFISLKDAALFVFRAWKEMQGGEIFIPKMKATTMLDLLEAVKGSRECEFIGRRAGEKIHECLVSSDESEYTTDDGWCLIRWPLSGLSFVSRRGTNLPPNSEVKSDQVPRFSQVELKSMIEEWEKTL